MNVQKQRLSLALGLLTLVGALTVWGAWSYRSPVAQAQGHLIRYVAPTGADSSDCADPAHPCATVQYAVDQAQPGDEVYIATGVYTDVHQRAGITQTVYISKTVTIRGGYFSDFAGLPDPETNPTTLDAQGQGRVLYIIGPISPTIEGLRITGGDASGLSGDPWQGKEDVGGGVYVVNAVATFHHNYVFSNTADYGGGFFLFYNSATLSDNTVTTNTASFHGGGLCLYDSESALNRNIIIANSANYSGGGLDLHSSAATLSDNNITANVASTGGGLMLSFSPATLSGNTLTANTANNGGGLYLLLANNATLTNNIITDNRAHIRGGGLFIHGSYSLHLLHITIARNSGSGFYITNDSRGAYSTVALTNTILVSHTVGITVTAGNTVTLEATLWGTGTWANGIDWGGAGTIDIGTRNTWGDPAFADPAAGDYHIGPGSAAINAGVDAGVTTDIDGDTRPDWCFPDIGADEFITGMGCTYFYLPLALRNHVP